jgi:type I restriction enzyme S subunit
MQERDENLFANLPKTWRVATIGDVAEVVSGGTPSTKREDYFGGIIPWITPADLSGYGEKRIRKGRRNISEKGLSESSAVLLPEGSVIFSSRAPIGYVAIAANPLATNQGCKNFIPSEAVFSDYLYYYLKSAKKIAEQLASGTTFLEISAKKAAKIPIPLPPVAEQRRIVAKIDQLFERLEAGATYLESTQVQCKLYRESVLKCAFRGTLSLDWRLKDLDAMPALTSSDELLTSHANKKGLNPDSSEFQRFGRPRLPSNWAWTTLGQVCKTTSGGTPSRRRADYYGGNIPWLKSGELNDGVVVSSEEAITEEALENSSTKIIPKGTLLIALYGATVGKMAVLGIDAAINQAICAIFPASVLNRTYLFWFLMQHKKELLQARKGGAQPNISQKIVNDIILPVAPKAEQDYVVEQIEFRISLATELQRTAIRSTTNADLLKTSILDMAFKGRLVSQNPNDEPASALLARTSDLAGTREAKIENSKTKVLRQTELRYYD